LGEVLDLEAGVCCDKKVGCAGIQRLFGCCRISTPGFLQPIISSTLFAKLSLAAQCSPGYCKVSLLKTLVSTKKGNRVGVSLSSLEASILRRVPHKNTDTLAILVMVTAVLIYGKERVLLSLELRHVPLK
jgi:hypothetical protein